jgi:hypothetical protein
MELMKWLLFPKTNILYCSRHLLFWSTSLGGECRKGQFCSRRHTHRDTFLGALSLNVNLFSQAFYQKNYQEKCRGRQHNRRTGSNAQVV